LGLCETAGGTNGGKDEIYEGRAEGVLNCLKKSKESFNGNAR